MLHTWKERKKGGVFRISRKGGKFFPSSRPHVGKEGEKKKFDLIPAVCVRDHCTRGGKENHAPIREVKKGGKRKNRLPGARAQSTRY